MIVGWTGSEATRPPHKNTPVPYHPPTRGMVVAVGVMV